MAIDVGVHIYEFTLGKVKKILRNIYEASISSIGGWNKAIELYREYVDATKGITAFEEWLVKINELIRKIPMHKPPTPLMIWGPVGIGKCVHPCTPVLIVRDGKPMVVQVKDVKPGDYVVAIKDDLSICLTKVLNVHKMYHKGYLYKIKTKTGREVLATDYHSFVVLTNGFLETKKGSELQIEEDVLPSLRHELPTLVEEVKIGTRTVKLTFELGYIIGLYLSEGSIVNEGNELRITNGDKNIIRKLEECLSKLNIRWLKRWNSDKKAYDIIIRDDKYLISWIEKEFGKGANRTHAGIFFFSAPFPNSFSIHDIKYLSSRIIIS